MDLSTTTAYILDTTTGTFLIFMSVVFLFVLVFILYIVWPTRDEHLKLY